MAPVVFVYVVFAFAILCILVNQRVLRSRRLQMFNIPYYIAPVTAVLILLIFGAITWSDVYKAITGYDFSTGLGFLSGSGPFSIVVLFLSVTFVAVALDVSGFFEYLAVKVLGHVQSSGKKIFIAIYLFTSILTLFTSNDILILTLTPFLIVFLRHLRVNPIPYLIAEFFAANILSMGLLVGNPTNIIVGVSRGITFHEYAAIMIIPALVAGAVSLALLYWIFRKDIDVHCRPEKLPAVRLNSWSLVVLALLAADLFALSISTMPLWHVSLLFAFLCVVFFCIPQMFSVKKLHDSYLYKINTKMPWEIVPFVLGFFMLVDAFSITGLTQHLGGLLYSMFGGSLIGSIFSIGLLSTFAANIFNNIPMTVFFSGITQNFSAGASYALAMGSNLGANLTPIGALAGIMWLKILKKNGIKMTFRQFLGYGMKVTIVTALVTLAAIYLMLVI